MVKKRRRHTAAQELRVALKPLEGSRPISQTLPHCTRAEDNLAP